MLIVLKFVDYKMQTNQNSLIFFRPPPKSYQNGPVDCASLGILRTLHFLMIS